MMGTEAEQRVGQGGWQPVDTKHPLQAIFQKGRKLLDKLWFLGHAPPCRRNLLATALLGL